MQISEKQMLEIYEKMTLIRASESKMVELFQKGEIVGHMLPCLGQEAIPATLSTLFGEKDFVITGHRGGGYYIARGCDFNGLWAELFGKVTGCNKGRGGQIHIMDLAHNTIAGNAIVGSQWGMAAGMGFAAKFQNRIALAVGGDASTNRGPFHEALNMAALHKLPVLFVVEANGRMLWNISEEFMSCKRISSRAAGYDIPGETVDGNNPMEIYKAALKFVEWIKKGEGPALLECITTRFRDSVSNLREIQENLDEMKKPENDPIARFEKVLREKGLLDNKLDTDIKKRVEDKLNVAIEFAKNSPFPDMYDGHDEVYSQPV